MGWNPVTNTWDNSTPIWTPSQPQQGGSTPTTTSAPSTNSHLWAPGTIPFGNTYHRQKHSETGDEYWVGYDPWGNPTGDFSLITTGTNTGSSTGSRGGGGGGGGGSSLGARQAYEDLFIDWFGVGGYQTSWLDKALAEQWTADDVRRFACNNRAAGPQMMIAITETQQALSRSGITNAPDSLVMSLISGGLWGSSSLEDYIPTLAGFDWTNSSNGAQFIDYWVEMTGVPPTYTAIQMVGDKIRELGWGGAWEWFQSWVPTTESAVSGNYGATKRSNIVDMVGTYLHRLPTAAELHPNNALWDMNEDALMEYIRQQPEYEVLFAGKPGWMNEDAYLSVRPSYDAVWRRIYGIQVPQPTGPGQNVNEFGGTLYTQPQQVTLPDYTAPHSVARPAWKSLNMATFITDLQNLGFTVEGSGPTGTYTLNGEVVPWNELIDHLPADTYYKDDAGYHYVQAPGAINPSSGIETPGWEPAAPTTPVSELATGAQPELPNIQGMPPELIRYYLNNFVSPDEIWQQSQWLEDVDYMRETVNPHLVEAFGSGFTNDELYIIASGAKGSGKLRARMVEAQNRLAYREVFRAYTGRDPGPGDYEYLSSNFVSPNEYARVTAAYEEATAKLPEINDLTSRVLGKTYTIDDIQGMVLGRQGSGALQAEINQAIKLDAYTWAFKQRYGRNPNPDEYAGFAGYSGVAEMVWQFKTTELVAEYRDEVQEVFREELGFELTDDDLWTLFGEMEGYGDLRAQWKEAQKKHAERLASEEAGWNTPRVNVAFAPSSGGGIETAFKPLQSI